MASYLFNESSENDRLKNSKNLLSTNSSMSSIFDLQPPIFPQINLSRFVKGIDNVHIDVYLCPRFTELTADAIYHLLSERTSTRRRFTDKPSPPVSAKLESFNAVYADILTVTLHQAKEGKYIDLVQLFQIAVIKFILNMVKTKFDLLLRELRSTTLSSSGSEKALQSHERILWTTRNKNRLLYQVAHELFQHIQWTESGVVKQLRKSLLGVTWSIPEEVLFNPLLQSPDEYDHDIMMVHYVLLFKAADNEYTIDFLDTLFEKLFEEIAQICEIPLDEKIDSVYTIDGIDFSWKDVPSNMESLFNQGKTLKALSENSDNQLLKYRLKNQEKANKILDKKLRPVLLNILSSYEIPRLYEHYAHLLSPQLLYRALCDEINLQSVSNKLQIELKIRPLRRKDDKPLAINELANTQKELRRLTQQAINEKLWRFTKDFITYRRDLKYLHLIKGFLDDIHLLEKEADVQLSRSNRMLYEFLGQASLKKNVNDLNDIKGHVILKADLRGSTTMTTELRKRGLNPATHFSRNFFNPIRQLIGKFGAEKVFIEGDAVILSLFEYNTAPDQWLAVSRACGLARDMLRVVDAQNQISLAHSLPVLELGIGICYSSEPPTFLYDGDQRIMISSAIGNADRLSSCSWKLRKKYEYQKTLLTHVIVFQQAVDDEFKGEKGMTTFRYNLNGIELEKEAFEKLRSEIALQTFKIRLPDEPQDMLFFRGEYPDAKGDTNEVVIREGIVRLWQENSEQYPLTNTVFYEVVSNKIILNKIKDIFN
jgi:hypothetical protein